jgi:hypothetical protein
MATEEQKIYQFEDGLPQNHTNPDAVDFRKNNKGQYPAKVILNPKYKDIGSKFFILFPTNLTAAIEPLGNNDIGASIAQGYYADVEYDETINEKTLICRGFANLS